MFGVFPYNSPLPIIGRPRPTYGLLPRAVITRFLKQLMSQEIYSHMT